MTMKIVMEKLEKIDDTVSNVRVSVGKIEEHLKTLNGSVERHEKDIKSMRMLQYKTAGAVFVLVAIAEILIQTIL